MNRQNSDCISSCNSENASFDLGNYVYGKKMRCGTLQTPGLAEFLGEGRDNAMGFLYLIVLLGGTGT